MGEIEGDTPEAMAGALPPHNQIQSNVMFELNLKLRSKDCNTFGSDQRIFIPETGLYTYPDISVFCGALHYEDRMSLKNPVLLVEILSKVRRDYDRSFKFEMYRSILTFIEYLMVDSLRVHVEVWLRENGKWVLAKETNEVKDSVELKSVDDMFKLEDFYYRALELIEQQEKFGSIR